MTESEPGETAFMPQLRVLVVDDDEPTLQVVAAMLQKCSYRGESLPRRAALGCPRWDSREAHPACAQSPRPRAARMLCKSSRARRSWTLTWCWRTS